MFCCFTSPKTHEPAAPPRPPDRLGVGSSSHVQYPPSEISSSKHSVSAAPSRSETESRRTRTERDDDPRASTPVKNKSRVEPADLATDPESDDALSGKVASGRTWNQDDKSQTPPPSISGEDWRRIKDNPACQDYIIQSTLGRGAFADVVLGRHRQTDKLHALKVVYLNKPGLKEKHIAVLQREGVYLRKIQHKNIVRCYKVYQGKEMWVFVLEYLKGGMLLNDLAKLKRYSEKTAAAVFRQVLSAVSYLHECGIVHRDIKPENVVFKHSVNSATAFGKDNLVKLVDFGMILDLSKEPKSRGMMGSPGFVAPEVILGQHHTAQMDNYSLGVLLFVMLVGAKPMTQDQARNMQYALMTPESLRGMHDVRWRNLTDAAKDLILKLLQPDPKNRLTARQALNHRWIKGARDDSILDGSVMEGWADQVQMMHPAVMGSPSPGFSPMYPRMGRMVPQQGSSQQQQGQYSRVSTPGRHQTSQQQSHSTTLRGHSNAPVSPLAMQMSGGYVPAPLSGPLGGNTQHWGGTTPTGEAGQSHPFAWAPVDAMSGQLSGPLSQPLPSGGVTGMYGDATSMTLIHDEVLKQAHEKMAQAHQMLMAAQVMRQADPSGRLSGVYSGNTAPLGTAPPSSPKPSAMTYGGGMGGGPTSAQLPSAQLQTDGTDSTQWTMRTQDHSLSAVAQSYMSTQNTSGAAAVSVPSSAAMHVHHRPVKTSEFDAVLKDTHNILNELTKAPSLGQEGSASNPDAHGFHDIVEGADDPAGYADATAAPVMARTEPAANSVESSKRRGSGRSHSSHGGSERPPASRGGHRAKAGSRNFRGDDSVRRQQLLDRTMEDAARDAYYGVGSDDGGTSGSSKMGSSKGRKQRGYSRPRSSSRASRSTRRSGQQAEGDGAV